MSPNPGIHSKHIILGSASPRRQSLLRALGFEFTVMVKEIDEVCPDEEAPDKIAGCLARMKADQFNAEDLTPDDVLITADTVVALNGRIIGKPDCREEAISMLEALSGQMHIVYTGVCIRSIQKTVCFTDATRVWFLQLKREDIIRYVDAFHPFDKAGSYGVQEWIGYMGVERIEGSFFNVMGLPTHRLYEELIRF
jgi:septum formation protein